MEILPSSNPVQFYRFLGDQIRRLPLQNACHSLIHGLFENASAASIQQDIRGCSNLNGRYTTAKLTPFHFAAIWENRKAMSVLEKAGADIDAKDIQGYTPLHHMAMKGNVNGVKSLLKLGADETARTNYGATYMDFLRWNEPFRESSSALSLNPALFSAHQNDQNRFDPVCLPKTARAVDEIVATPKALINLWKATREDINQKNAAFLSNFWNDRYQEFKKNPPKLSVVPISANDAGEQLPLGKGFCSLIADEPIKKGQMIGEYTGEVITDSEKDRRSETYLWTNPPPIDADRFRSPIAMANDGFPNAYVTAHEYDKQLNPGVDGLVARKFVLALDDIAPGEQITIDYGATYKLKWGTEHVEFKPQSLRRFLQQNSWEKIIKSFFFPSLSKRASDEERVNLIASSVKMQYLFQTPSSFEWAAKKGLVTQKDLNLIETTDKKTNFLEEYQLGREGVRRARKVLQLKKSPIDDRGL